MHMANNKAIEVIRLTEHQYEISEKQKRYLSVKRIIDVAVAGCASVVLSPFMGVLALAIKLDSPGPVLFRQKRIGKDKEIFEIWKFRTMRTDTPKDVPTHMLENPDAYITRTGKFMRKYSLDELPQFWQVVRGQLTIVGPRPALWNQDDLVAERDKYGVNSLKPGITGWAQINGRDELEIPIKAKLDGEYVRKMGFGMDVKCFLATVGSVLSHNGVVEGGTGKMHKEGEKTGEGTVALVSAKKINKKVRIGALMISCAALGGIGLLVGVGKQIAKKKDYEKDGSLSGSKLLAAAIAGTTVTTAGFYIRSKQHQSTFRKMYKSHSNHLITSPDTKTSSILAPKKILITGAGSYIGMSVKNWLERHQGQYVVDTLDMIGDGWRDYDFSPYYAVYHVAGIAHVDVRNVTEEQKKLYYQVNTKLALETAGKAKAAGVRQFIFMSSMIVYSGCKETLITAQTEPKPINFYGDSKWQADQRIRELETDTFKVVILRPPMIYGKGSRGNYPELAKLATKLPCFPEVKNKRSMLYIDNLCQFVKLMIDNEESGIFFPQNGEYTNTSEMVEMIASVKGHTIVMIPGMSFAAKLLKYVPGKIGELSNKAFRDLCYDMEMSKYKDNYQLITLAESILITEENGEI